MKRRNEVYAGFDLVVHLACCITPSERLQYAYLCFAYMEKNCYGDCRKIIFINTKAKACYELTDLQSAELGNLF